jgi:hypothetical protein
MVGAGKSFRLPPRVPRYRVVSETGSRASSTAGEPWKRTKSFSYEDEAKAGFDGVELDERELRALNRSN